VVRIPLAGVVSVSTVRLPTASPALSTVEV